jgi:Flp pilus assembly protein TadD
MCEQVITRRPDMADAYRELAFIYWETGRPGPAIGTLTAAITRGVKQRELQVKLGIYLAETGATAKAISLLETITEDDTEALNALGIAYGAAGRRADAARAFQRALALDPTNGLAHQNLGTLDLIGGNLSGAEASLREALAIDPTLAEAHTTLGVVLAATGRRTEAVDAWKRAVELEPTEFKALYNLVKELAAQSRTAELQRYGDQYVRTAPPALYPAEIAQVRKLLAGR